MDGGGHYLAFLLLAGGHYWRPAARRVARAPREPPERRACALARGRCDLGGRTGACLAGADCAALPRAVGRLDGVCVRPTGDVPVSLWAARGARALRSPGANGPHEVPGI